MRSEELTEVFDKVNSAQYRLNNNQQVDIPVQEIKLMKSQLSREFERYAHLIPKLNKTNRNGVELVTRGVKNNMRMIKKHLYKVNEIIEAIKTESE